jgi:hypothetical protein
MKKTISILFGFLLLTACASAGAPPISPTPLPQQANTATHVLPTPSSPGNSIVWREWQVTMIEAELTEDFITEFGTSRVPPTGKKFMWVHVQLKNMGQDGIDVPPSEHFSVLYAEAELKPTYGHRKDHSDYMVLDQVIFPDQAVDAWLRFDVPAAAELKGLRFVFLPESSQVGVSFSSPTYPYAEDHPTFVWNCEQ